MCRGYIKAGQLFQVPFQASHEAPNNWEFRYNYHDNNTVSTLRVETNLDFFVVVANFEVTEIYYYYR